MADEEKKLLQARDSVKERTECDGQTGYTMTKLDDTETSTRRRTLSETISIIKS